MHPPTHTNTHMPQQLGRVNEKQGEWYFYLDRLQLVIKRPTICQTTRILSFFLQLLESVLAQTQLNGGSNEECTV